MVILKQFRLKQHLYQKDVASRLGVDRTTYAKYESGQSEPPISVLLQLADIFGVTMDQLTGREIGTKEKLPAQDMDRQQLLSAIDRKFTELPQDLKMQAMAYVAGRIASRKE